MLHLEFKGSGPFSSDFEVLRDGRPIAYLDRSLWCERGSLTLDGVAYELRSRGFTGGEFQLAVGGEVAARAERRSPFGSAYDLTTRHGGDGDGDGAPLALALEKPSFWSSRYELRDASRTVGEVSRLGLFTSGARLSLRESTPLPLAVFVGYVALMLWRRRAAAAGTG